MDKEVLLLSLNLTLLQRKDENKGDMVIDGAYLAGLIEGDGCIYAPKEKLDVRGRRTYPMITITFLNKDLPFFEELLE